MKAMFSGAWPAVAAAAVDEDVDEDGFGMVITPGTQTPAIV
jgi:hypothetical protein